MSLQQRVSRSLKRASSFEDARRAPRFRQDVRGRGSAGGGIIQRVTSRTIRTRWAEMGFEVAVAEPGLRHAGRANGLTTIQWN